MFLLPRPLRMGLAFAAAAVVLAMFARPARGEEAIVLDNGAVLRGTVVQEDAATLVFKLSGVGTDSRITIAREHVVKRFVTVDPKAWAAGSRAAGGALPDGSPARPSVAAPSPVVAAAVRPPPLPDEEPAVHEEGFFARTARRAEVAFPTEPATRALLAALAIVVLLCLVGLGGKMAELQNLTLGRSTLLAFLLGGLVAVDWSFRGPLLRADHAAIVLAIELLAFVGFSAAMLQCGLRRAFQLLAFVVVAGSLVTLSTGAVLVLA